MKHITPRTLRKIGVYFILWMFLLSTVLMSAMYFIDMQTKNGQSEQLTGDIDTPAVTTGFSGTGS